MISSDRIKQIDDALRITPGPRDWGEDFDHENGQYMNRCLGCRRVFYGHKRRVGCKECAHINKEQQEDRTAT